MIIINYQSHTVKICYLFRACKAIIVNIAFVVYTRCENGGICRQMFLLQVITESCFLSNIITVIICSILMPWNAANAAYLRLIAAWNISHCDWLLTCWHIFICMPNTNHHVNLKVVGSWTNLSLSATISTVMCLLLSHCNVCCSLHCCMARKKYIIIICWSHWENYYLKMCIFIVLKWME